MRYFAAVLALQVAVTLPASAQADEDTARRMAILAIRNYGVGQAIEVVCPGWVVTPELQFAAGLFGKAFKRPEDAMSVVAAAMVETAETYNLKGDRNGFCSRVLKDHGPNGDPPKVARDPKKKR